MTPDDGPLPPPLPIRVRPAAGETAESYIRRLARANHLRPSLLQVYVRNPDVPTGTIRPRRLAAVSGSTLTSSQLVWHFRLHQLSGRGSLITYSRTRGLAKSRKRTIWPSRMRRIWMDVAANDWPVVVRVPFVRISTITTSGSWVW